jgi:hypothetical protein
MRNLKYTVSNRVADGNVDAVRNNALLKKSLQFVGWTILMWRLVPHLTQLKAPTEVLYANVGGLLRCVQTAAFLEVAHAAFGKTFKRFSLSEEIGH